MIESTLTALAVFLLLPLAGYSLYAKLFRRNTVRVVVSRGVMYRSITLLSVGAYFIALGLISGGLKHFEVSFARSITIFFAFAGAIALTALFLSERLRRRVKVFINKHFYEQKHDYRRTWMALTGRLASCTTLSDMENAILEMFRETFGLRGVSLYLYNRRSGVYAPAIDHSLPRAEAGLRLSAGLLGYFRDRDRVWNPLDKEYVPDDAEASFVSSAGARLVIPLVSGREVEGVVVFGERMAREPFTYEDYDLMKIMARQSALLLSNQRLTEELVETRELAAVARVSSFVIHDLKNLTQTLSLIMDNADEHIGNPDFQRDMLASVKQTVGNMKHLMQKLNAIPGTGKPNLVRYDIRLLTTTVVGELAKTRPGKRVVCLGTTAPCMVDTAEMSKVIVNLVQNGLDATEEAGMVKAETGANDGRVFLRISDTGCGMNGDFVLRQVFKLFRTTKGEGLGVGLYQCRQIVESMGGTIEVKSEVGKGSEFTVYLPAVRQDA
ncbi:MAG TPA: XrtA/PEP-CTERM system histidine kinase PrsK [Nitrospirota bacterium]|nr:XrtA/PEP-CTERM system histidine kinase PrsK [Nitrospirota bacterium]